VPAGSRPSFSGNVATFFDTIRLIAKVSRQATRFCGLVHAKNGTGEAFPFRVQPVSLPQRRSDANGRVAPAPTGKGNDLPAAASAHTMPLNARMAGDGSRIGNSPMQA
jgi:hypothetical protein